MPHITMVKKRFADGNFCRKCEEVDTRLKHANLTDRIDRVVVADEADPSSEGMRLALHHNVERAPFFIVRDEQGQEQVYTVYFQFVKEVLQQRTTAQAENQELAQQIDFL